MSQVGLLVVMLGLGFVWCCYAHLVAHAIFKSALFMAIGNMIHALHGVQDRRSIRVPQLSP